MMDSFFFSSFFKIEARVGYHLSTYLLVLCCVQRGRRKEIVGN